MLDLQPYITADHIEEAVDKAYSSSRITSLDLIADESTLNFRNEPDTDVPAADYSGDSESDDSPPTPTVSSNQFGTFAALSSGGKPQSLNETVVGGAVVSNLCLVVPGREGTFADLPIVPIKGSKNVTPQLLAAVPDDKAPKQLPVLLMPEEGNHVPAAQALQDDLPADTATLSNLIKTASNVDEAAEGEQKILKKDPENYVLSGDIKNFFGIKGLNAKLYKYKGPSVSFPSEDENVDQISDQHDDAGDEETDSPGGDSPQGDTPKDDVHEEGDALQDGETEEDGDGTDGNTGGDTGGDIGDQGPSEPAREKIKLNPSSIALAGQPLGTLFPFIDDEDLRKMPITNIEFTYCEEQQGVFFPTGLRLEADVMLTGSLQWASDALKSIFGDQAAPDSIHLSAHLSDKRDWSKRPVLSKFVLQGYFKDIALRSWDVLKFKTMGIEITGTKAARSKQVSDEAQDGGDESKDPASEDLNGEKGTKDTGPESAPPGNKQTKPDGMGGSKPEGKGELKPETKPQKPEGKGKTKPDDKIDAKPVDKGEIEEPEKPDTEDDKGDGNGESKDEGEGEGEGQGNKPKEPQSWNFGFGFFGTVMLTKVPHANAPIELNYRIARDFEFGGEVGAESFRTSAVKETPEQPDMQVAKGGSKTSSKPSNKKPPKQWSDGQHKRIWNMVIWCDEWEDIYGINNVSLTNAELKFSFEQGKFAETVVLDLEANLSLGSGTFSVVGKFSKDENSLDAEVGDLTMSEMKKIHAQIAGYEIPETIANSEADAEADAKAQAKGNDITFKKLHLNLSSTKADESIGRSLQLDGCVDFNEHSSSSALLMIDQDGLTISGDIKEFNIPDTHLTIQKAGLHIYIGFKQGKKSQKAVKGAKGSKNPKPIADGGADGKETPKPDAKDDKDVTRPDGEAEKPDESQRGTKRASQFSILGTVQIENFTVTAGLHIEQKPEKKNRDWVLIGSVASMKLNELWADVKGGFLDLELDNVALIASSEERKRKALFDAPSDGDSWDVLAQLDTWNYPVVKGVQLCATIRKFEKLDELNNKKKMEGLVLAVAFPAQGKLSITIDLPMSMEVPIRDYAKLGEFGAAIIAGKAGPCLQLNATLTLLFNDQPPIRVRGDVKGDIEGAKGELFMDSEDMWINPFKLNKKVIISTLGIGAGFKYATVWVEGPDRLEASGTLNIGAEFHASMALSLGLGKDQVISINITEINIVKLVRLAAEMCESQALADLKGGEDILVFRDLVLYMSTGAKVFDIYYERGIHIQGAMEFFKKAGDFKGRITDDGMTIKAGVDQFNIGGLEVTSASADGKRAILDIEMTNTKQRILIDGMIRYHDIHASIFLDADMQERRLDANISLQLIENLSFNLKAHVRVPQEYSYSLDGLVAKFEAELRPDVFGAIFDGIENGIDALGKAATQVVDSAINDIQGQIGSHEKDLQRLGNRLEELKAESDREVAKREQDISKDNTELTKLRDELDRLQGDVTRAENKKSLKDDEVNRKRAERDNAQRKLDSKVREMTSEYNRKLREQQNNQSKWQAEKQRLENEKNHRWGDDLRSSAGADAMWNYWNNEVNKAYRWKEDCWAEYQRAWWPDSVGKWLTFSNANIDLETKKGNRDYYTTLMNIARDIMNSSAFIEIEDGITNAVTEITKFTNAVNALTTEGVYGYVREMSKDEKAELNRQIQLLSDLEAESQKLQAALTTAKNELERNRGRITTKQKEAQSSIARLEQEIQLKPFESEYRAKQLEHANVTAKLKVLQQTLKDVRDGVDAGTQAAKKTVEALKKGMPRITLIVVKASTDVFVKNEPLIFSVTVEWLGETSKLEVTWVPGTKPEDLYKGIADKVIGLR